MTSTTTYSYNAAGKLISQSIDNNSDGTIDSVITYDYKLTFYTSSFDGNINNYVTTYTYDASGNQTSVSEDNNGDGIADRVTTYTYDANGNKTSESYVEDGIVDEVTAYEYDAKGKLTALKIFLALNNDTNGFSALTDAVIEITGYKGNLTDLASNLSYLKTIKYSHTNSK
ncbi:MAG: bluetail domain-containing putative surface protein [Nostoc sp. S4]|nr:bluetail domain-containing putative surface protein [Nostoc sp. S4]